MRTRPLPILLTAAAGALALVGCGVSDPYQHPAHATSDATSSTTSTSPTNPTTTLAAGSTSASNAVAVIRRYTMLSIDWTSRTLAARQRRLEGLATAGARAQAAQTAASYGTGSSLQHSRVANHGQITSIARGQGPRRGWWVITTQETTTGSGDYHGLPSRTHVYDAKLTHTTTTGWKVSTWSPQN